MTRRAFSLVPLSRTLDHLIPALTDTHNAQWAQLCLHWDRVVGPALASCCRPKKIMMASKKQSRGVLHLAVWDGKALEIGYQSLTICDRVNAYFGFQAVHQVRCASSAPPMTTCPRL